MKLINLVEKVESKMGPIDERNFVSNLGKYANDAATLKNVNKGLYDALLDVLNYSKTDKNQIVGATRKSPNAVNPIRNVDDLLFALKTTGGMTPEVYGFFNQGLLKSTKTPRNILDDIAKDVVASDSFIKTFAGKTDDEMRSLLQSKGYSPNSIDELITASKNEPKFTLQRGTGSPSPSGTSKPPKITDRLKQLPKNIKDGLMNLLRAKKGWRVIVKWAILAGVPLGVLWWFIQDYITSGGTPPEGYPQNVPQDFPPCVQDLVKNKSGEVITNVNGTVYVFVKNNEFPDGLKFYPTASNGASRVMDVKTGKKGSYKCEGQKVALQEQGTEIDLDTMADYVDTAVDDLDGYVNTGNLNSLLTILKNLKGKTFQGKNALGEFLSLYKDEEGTDFMSDVNGVGVKTIGTKGILAKRDILSLLSGGGENDPTTETTSADLSGIKITWDPASDSSDGSGSSDGSDSGKVKYTYKQDFPFPRGTSNEKIREIQKCLKFEPKYHTGNFGPITQKGLIKFIGDSANVKYGLTGGFNIYIEELKTKGITRELYDIVMRACGKMPITGDTATGGGTPGQVTPGTETPGQVTPGQVTPGTETPGQVTPGTETTPEQTPATTRETPAQLFNRFVKEEKIKGRFNGERIVYKGGDLTDGDREKLISQLDSMGFRVSREDRDYRQGDKIVFKKNETEE